MKKKFKKLAGILLLAAVSGGYLFLRGPQVSNYLKDLLFTQFDSRTGYELTAGRLYANLFPFYVGARDIRMLDDKGNVVFSARGIKAYVGLSALLEKKVLIRRLVLSGPDIRATDGRVEHFLRLPAPKRTGGGFSLRLESVVLRNGALSYVRGGSTRITCRGLDARVALDKKQASLSCADVQVQAGGIPRINAKLKKAGVSFRGDVFRLNAFSLETGGSRVDLSGYYSRRGGGRVRIKTRISAATLRDDFHLRNPAGGDVRLAGEARLPGLLRGEPAGGANGGARDWKETRIDMRVNGGLYVQTLLELLHVNADVNGFSKVDAHVSGPLADLTGSGKGSLQQAVIYGAAARRLDFGVRFQNGLLSFDNIKGRLYGGRAAGRFSINIGRARNKKLSTDVVFSGLDSRRFLAGFLKLHLPLPEGRLSGRMINQAAEFDPWGDFRFRATSRGRDFLRRIRTVKSDFVLDVRGRTVHFSRMLVRTGLTTINGGGTVNYGKKTVDMDFSMLTEDLRDLTLPYSTLAEGAGGFVGSVSGPIENPTFTGRVSASGAFVKGVKAGSVNGVISYNKDLLQISSLGAKTGGQTIKATGRILFPKAKEIFDLAGPDYDVDLELSRFPAAAVLRLIKPDMKSFKLSGLIVAADLKVKGPIQKGPVPEGPVPEGPVPEGPVPEGPVPEGPVPEGPVPEFSGRVRAADIAWGPVPQDFRVSSARFDFDYADGRLSIPDGLLMEKGSIVRLSGTAGSDGRFTLNARSEGVDIKDLFPGKRLPVDYMLSFTASGGGTFEKPRLEVEGNLRGGRYKGRPVRGGKFRVSVSSGSGGRTAAFQVSLQGGGAVLKGRALLEGDLPWQADLALKEGPYGYLVSAFLKNAPPHLFVGLQGGGQFRGSENSISGSLVLNRLVFGVSGQHFSASKPVSLEVRDKTLTLRSLALSGPRAAVNVSGAVTIGTGFDVYIKGKSSLELLQGFMNQSLRAGLLSGDAGYALHVGGPWGRPDLSGDVCLSDAVVDIAGMPLNLRIMSACMHMGEGRIVLQKFIARTGGGRMNATGVLYLNGLKPAGYYFEGTLQNVGLSVRGLDAVLDGNFLFREDHGARSIAGEMFIKRAVYSKNVDLKGLILKNRAASLPPSPGSFEATTGLALRVYGSRNIMLANNVARAPLSIDLTLRGTLAHPVPLGRVQTSSGKIYFGNHEFSIGHASVIFADPNRSDPFLDMLAYTTVKGYRVTINVSGTTSRLNMAFSSEPHLENMQILSLLTTGNFSGNGGSGGTAAPGGAGGGVDAFEASSFLTGQYQKVITDRLKSIAGLDRFEVAPYISEAGTVSPMITVSKRLLGDKLFVIYSAPIGSQNQIVRMEYAVSPKISIVGERDDTGDLGGDMEFKFRFR
ncbi:MAG: translocation/assembly module TamB domain-containing protein [Nitrospiraceae bacterium]|nr:translocation/assembly module TamB domain-containing protein [Nitrospiraceae bacterium]